MRLARRWRDRRGGVTVLAAAGMAVMLGSAALAVDLGSLFLESRRLQGIADAAAMAAAADPANMAAEARAAVTASGWARPITTDITPGLWSPAVLLRDRFVATTASPNAARVVARATASLFFARALGVPSVALSRTATAARTDLASFSVGSRLAALDGGLANALLTGLTGSSVSLSVMDYQSLIGADVDLLAFSDALRTRLGLTGASYNSALAASVTPPQALGALGDALAAGGAAGAAASVRTIAAAATGLPAMAMNRVIDLGPLGAQDHVTAGGGTIAVSAFDLLRTVLEVAGGPRQAQLALAGGVPGLASVGLWLSIGDRPASSPWVAVTASGDPIIRTAQTRLYVLVSVGAGSALALLGGTGVRLPLYVELAEAQARLSQLSCASGGRSVTLLAKPSPGHASIAEVDTARLGDQQAPLTESPARLLTLGLLSVTAQTRTDLAAGNWQSVPFSASDIAARATKTVNSSGMVTGIAQSLTGQTNIGISLAGIPVINLGLGTATRATLLIAAPLVDGLLDSVTGLLGVHLGQADLRVTGVRCGAAALVA